MVVVDVEQGVGIGGEAGVFFDERVHYIVDGQSHLPGGSDVIVRVSQRFMHDSEPGADELAGVLVELQVRRILLSTNAVTLTAG